MLVQLHVSLVCAECYRYAAAVCKHIQHAECCTLLLLKCTVGVGSVDFCSCLSMLCNPRVQAQPEAMSFVSKEALEAMLGCSLFVNEITWQSLLRAS